MGYDPEVVHQISRLVDLAEYKRRQSPLGPKVSKSHWARQADANNQCLLWRSSPDG